MKSENPLSARLHIGDGRHTRGIAAILRGLCIFIALLFLTPALLACSSKTDDIIVLENKNDGKQNGKANGTSDRSDGENGAAADGRHYILNTQSRKIHLPSCSAVLRMGEENREERFDFYDTLLEEGYIPCISCLKEPPEKEKEGESSDYASSDPVSPGGNPSGEKDADPTAPVYKIDPLSKKIHKGDCAAAGAASVTTIDSVKSLWIKGYAPCSRCMGSLSDVISGEEGGDPLPEPDPEPDPVPTPEPEPTPEPTPVPEPIPTPEPEPTPEPAPEPEPEPTPSPEPEPTPDPDPEEVTYILNTSTKKFHLPGCSSTAKIADKNRSESHSSADELIAKGYSPCKICKPA